MEIPKISLDERKTTFKEVELSLTQEQAIEQANRCENCTDHTCIEGCPAKIDIPGFMKAFREGDLIESVNIIRKKNFFPSVCGRICQHENQCEAKCIYAKDNDAVLIGAVERFIGDHAPFSKSKKFTKKKAAIIGSGPSGLTVAAYLAMAGVNVTVHEATNSFGGVMKYGVPEFRLPKKVVSKDLNGLQELGIDFEPNSKVAEESVEELSKSFDVIFIGTGAGTPRKLNILGAELKGVIPAIKFLVNLNQSDMPMISKGEEVIVIGGGYVGIDAARSAIRLGAKKVICLSSAKKEDVLKSISKKDIFEAEIEGVIFKYGYTAKKIELVNSESDIKKVFYSNSKDDFLFANKVIYAIGQIHCDTKLKKSIRNEEKGNIEVDDNFKTQIENIFAAGDCVHGPKTVIHAIDTGRRAAKAMLNYLNIKD